jgi:hypothetical protein
MAITGFGEPRPNADNRLAAEASWDDLRDKSGRSLKAVRFLKPWGCYVEGDLAGPKPSEVQRLIDLGIALPVYKDAAPTPEPSTAAPATPAPAPAPDAPRPDEPAGTTATTPPSEPQTPAPTPEPPKASEPKRQHGSRRAR